MVVKAQSKAARAGRKILGMPQRSRNHVREPRHEGSAGRYIESRDIMTLNVMR